MFIDTLQSIKIQRAKENVVHVPISPTEIRQIDDQIKADCAKKTEETDIVR